MQTENKLFDIIDFCLKKKDIDLEIFNNKSTYILNRWLSMCDNNILKIVNSTTNRWSSRLNNINILKFYRVILPKINKKIKYIKKTSNINSIQKEEDSNISILASNLQLSTREIELYEDTIDFLSKNNN